MIQIDPQNPVTTVINQCTVEPEYQDEFTQLWGRCLQVIRKHPGFISASVHKSRDGWKVTTYMQWRSPEDHESCMDQTDWSQEAEARIRELLDSGRATIDPQVYDVVTTVEGAGD